MYTIMSTCIKCGICEDACPVGAISFVEGSYKISEEKCINCGACAVVCPVNAISK